MRWGRALFVLIILLLGFSFAWATFYLNVVVGSK